MESSAAVETSRAARTATLAAVGGYLVIGGFLVVADAFAWIRFNVTATVFICAGIAVVNLSLALLGPRWLEWRPSVYVYEGLHAAMLTVVLYFLGGISTGIFVILYAFIVIHTEMLRPEASVFVTANVCVAFYATLALLEGTGLVHPEPMLDARLTAGQRWGFVVLTFLALNVFAAYANRSGHQLRTLAGRLQEMVATRTVELTIANRELGTKAAALEQKQEELRAFVYTVTHDLKNPVNAILLITTLLLQRKGDALGASEREDMERVVRLAGATENMIRDLMSFFRITSVAEQATWVELDGVAASVLEALQPQIAAKGIRVTVGALPRVWGQREKLMHVLSNLIGNAVKYVAETQGEIEVDGELRDGEARLWVRDNGIGIPPRYHKKIFELYGRVPEQVNGSLVEGSGIGLAIVRRIVHTHGGGVAVESEPGTGSRFIVTLPSRGED